MTAAAPPVWRRAFDAVEQQVTPVVLGVLRSDDFAVVLDRLARTRQEALRAGRQLTRVVLHAANLPVGTDIARLLSEVGRLQSETHRLRDQVGDLQRHLCEGSGG